MSEAWIRCEVRKGMFSDEFVVVITAQDGEKTSFFVPKDRVKGEVESEGKLKVQSFHDQKRLWAVIPNDQQSIISVEQSELAQA